MGIKQPSRKKAVLTQVVGGYLNTAVSITQGLLLLPIYFKFIDYTTYGYWITIGSIIALLGIINFGIGNMVTQRISSSYAKKDIKAVSEYFINSQFLYFIIAITILIVGYILSLFLQDILSFEDSQKRLFNIVYMIALITASLTVLSNSVIGFSQALLKPLFGVYSTIVSRIIGIVLTVNLLYQNSGLISIPIGLLITEIFIFSTNSVYCYIQYKKLNIKSKFQKSILLEYLHFSPHLFGLILGNMLSNKSHPLIITTFLGAEMTTAYIVTRKAIEIINQSINIINSSLIGPFSHLVGEGNKDKIKQISLKIMSIGFFATFILFGTYIATNHMFVSLWISSDIVLSQNIIIVMGIGALSYAMTRLFRSQLFGLNEFKFTSIMILLEGIIFVLLSIPLIKYFGVIGIAISLLFVSSMVAIILGLKIIKKLDIKVNILNILKQLFIMIFLFKLVNILNGLYNLNWINFIILSISTIIVFCVFIFITNYQYLKNIKLRG